MGNLTSSYEISIWLDKLVDGIFQEERICVIGSDTMLFDGRAIEPRLTRNINGEKKFSFKMYKRFIDTVTGEKVNNPFSEHLINEAKVKLYYKDKWHDFYVKNIVENSSTYLYTYELADASVQELSKNGYGVTFDAKLMNNLGTAKQLAEATLEGTDWSVESEAFVEKVVDNLVYAHFKNVKSFEWPIYQILDQTDLNSGIGSIEIDKSQLSTGDILGFYSSCKNKPHRFQFIYLNSYDKDEVLVDQDNNIINKDCQYYVDIPSPEVAYESAGDFYLPRGLQIKVQTDKLADTTISTWYKAKRYGFSQQTQYVPLLEKYCNIYKKDNIKYYGYLNSEYSSPALVTNMITNAEFKGTTGWAGSYSGPVADYKKVVGAIVEPLCGRFIEGIFQSAIDDLQNGNYSSANEYTNYLKVEFPLPQGGCKGILINSGFYDNRGAIEVPQAGDKWYIEAEIYDNNNNKQKLQNFQFSLGEIRYDTETGSHVYEDWTSYKTESGLDNIGVLSFDAIPEELTESRFKNKTIKLIIRPKEEFFGKTYYIQSIKLYKEVFNSLGDIIKPGDLATDGTVVNNYVLIPADQAFGDDAKNDVKELTKTVISAESLDYSIFIPQYNVGAEKIRTITAKESNYFNILQSIAETFECWMDIVITRDDKGTHKTIKFKNFTGNDNPAYFKYGVNLKDIQRTYESKQLATKLIVKQNNNKLADNGYCTIAKAGSNPTGENYIYDFQYYHKTGLLDALDYSASMYYHTNPLDSSIVAQGPDIDNYIGNLEKYPGQTNLQNYFNRIKTLNTNYEPISNDLVNLNKDLLKLKADLAIQEGLVDASAYTVEESADQFFNLTGFYPAEANTISLMGAQCFDGLEEKNDTKYESSYNHQVLNYGYNFKNNTITITATPEGPSKKSLTYRFDVNIQPKEAAYETVVIDEEGVQGYDVTSSDGTKFTTTEASFSCNTKYGGLKIVPQRGYIAGYRYKLDYTIQAWPSSTLLQNIGSHRLSFKEVEFWIDGKKVQAEGDRVTLNSTREPIHVTVYGTYCKSQSDADARTNALFIQPNRSLENQCGVTVTNISLSCCSTPRTQDRNFYIQPIFELKPQSNDYTYRYDKIAISIPAYSLQGSTSYTYEIADFSTRGCSDALQQFATSQQEHSAAEKQVALLKEAITQKETLIAENQAKLKRYTDYKNLLNKLFYSQYYRFIQEGTWMSEDYVDHDKYYNDALSVLYNSCYPQVAYNINVIALNGLPDYEKFSFDIGENTYVEDSDFFGKDKEGNEIRVRVAITEMTEDLDNPIQNHIKVSNFKNDFADLFHKITATVQQAQYNSGAYEKAVELAEANAELKGAFLHEGLENMGDALSLAGQTTVVQNASGITLTDSNTKNQMRLIGGAILMGVEDPETGERKWKTGLTPEGISASLIQAGTVNTGIINIMNATEPTFKWDSFGISAYDTDWTGGLANGRVDPSKFVRYDKYGLYGINSATTSNNVYIDGSSWHPTSMDDIRQNATFALTWDGLFLKLGSGNYTTDTGENKWHNPFATIGKVDNNIFNYFDKDGIPRYSNKEQYQNNSLFTRIFVAGENKVEDKTEYNLVIYDNGTLACRNLYLTEGIHYTVDTSPYRQVYAVANLPKPTDGTRYSNFGSDTHDVGPDGQPMPVWHTTKTPDDKYYSETENAGDTWAGPHLIIKAIKTTVNEYQINTSGLNPATLNVNNWNTNYPTTALASNQCIYIRTYDIYDDNTISIYRYSVGGERGEKGEKGDNAISCYVESLSGNFFLEGSISTITLTARIYSGNDEVDKDGKLSYTWFIDETKQTDAMFKGKTITIPFSAIQNKSIYFEAE